MPFRIFLITAFCVFAGAAWRLQPGVTSRRAANLQQYLYSTDRLSVMTWNVGRARFGDDDGARSEDMPHVADVIGREHPDIVALQELSTPAQADVLAQRLGRSYSGWFSSSRSGRSLALLVRRKHRVREVFALRARNRRRALAALVERPKLEEPVLVTALHADPLDARARRMLIEDVVAQLKDRKGATLLIGDFNLDVWGDADKYRGNDTLTERLTHDAESYSLLSRYFTDLGKSANATALFKRRLDYVFVRPRNTVAVSAQVLNEARGEMDHQPLLVRADLLAKPRMQLGR